MNKLLISRAKITPLFLGLGLITLSFAQPAFSAGKPISPTDPSNSCGAGGGAVTTPNPIRKVILQPMGTKLFQLPNGAAVDMTADLQTILSTAVIAQSNFAPSDPDLNDPCHSYLELRSTVTTFQLDVAELGITVGYTPSGQTSVVTGANGNLGVKVGTIAMDFSVWQCTAGYCSAVAATTATQLTSGVNLNFNIDFGAVKTSTAFLYNTPLGDLMRKIMVNAMSQLATSPRIAELPWDARVRDVNSATATVTFDAGFQSRIEKNQAFEVYSPTDNTASGTCNVYESVAYVHTTGVGAVSSTAVIDQVNSSRGVQVGDVVMIRKVKTK